MWRMANACFICNEWEVRCGYVLCLATRAEVPSANDLLRQSLFHRCRAAVERRSRSRSMQGKCRIIEQRVERAHSGV